MMRKARYRYMGFSQDTEQWEFIRPLGQDFYPRFHIYLKQQGEEILCNIHLDQRRPRYAGTTAHNADYDGELVEDEVQRIKDTL